MKLRCCHRKDFEMLYIDEEENKTNDTTKTTAVPSDLKPTQAPAEVTPAPSGERETSPSQGGGEGVWNPQ